jgi:hypothetical protein
LILILDTTFFCTSTNTTTTPTTSITTTTTSTQLQPKRDDMSTALSPPITSTAPGMGAVLEEMRKIFLDPNIVDLAESRWFGRRDEATFDYEVDFHRDLIEDMYRLRSTVWKEWKACCALFFELCKYSNFVFSLMDAEHIYSRLPNLLR